MFHRISKIIKMKKESIIDKPFNSFNHFALKIKKYFRGQKPQTNTSTKFVDELFPPNSHSVFSTNENGDFNDKISTRVERGKNEFNVKEEEIIWLSADQIFEGKFCLFEDKIEFDDIKQGSMSNCYFLSSIAAITEFPELLVALFRSLKVSENGYYEVVLRLNGEWQVVILDDYFPCDKSTRRPHFCKPNGNELWVMLLEKAWAKINGGYFNINLGYATEPLVSLTNFPVEMFMELQRYDPTELWNRIKNSDEKGYILSTGTISDESVREMGLMPGHAFTLISAKEAIISGKNERILNLRNPWGFKEWNGKWSDHSLAWTEEAKSAFGIKHQIKDDGSFWIDFEDYLKYYYVFEVCYKTSILCAKTIHIDKTRRECPHVFELYIPKESLVTCQIIKRNYRFNRKIPENPILMSNIILVKKNEETNKFEWIEGKGRSYNNPIITKVLTEGVYLVYNYVNYEYHTYDKKRNWVLEITSSNLFNISFKSFDEDFSSLKLILQHYIEPYISDEIKFQPISVMNVKAVDKTNFGIIYYKNNSNVSNQIQVKHEFQNMSELKSYNQFRANENNLISYVLAPNATLNVLALKMNPEDDCDIGNCEFQAYQTTDSDHQQLSQNKNEDLLKMLLQNLPMRSEEYNSEDYYTWIHKLFNLEIDTITQPINNNKINLKMLKGKYPNEVDKIKLFKNQLFDKNVILKDMIECEDGSKYLGQWKVENPEIKQGIGYFDYGNGSYYCGNVKNNVFDGIGIYCQGNARIEIMFVNGVMEGEGKYTNLEENWSAKCYYSSGKFVKWIE